MQQPRATFLFSRACAACLGALAWAWAAGALAEPIPAHWRSIPPVADRAGIQVAPQGFVPCVEVQGECLELRLTNTHPFPVVLEELAARHPFLRPDLHAAEGALELPAGATLNARLRRAPPEFQAWRNADAFPVAFRVRLSDAHLDKLSTPPTDLSPRAAAEWASAGRQMDELGRAEREVWRQWRTDPQALDAQLERLAPLLPGLVERGCAGQRDALVELEARWEAGQRDPDEAREALRRYVGWRKAARREPALLECASQQVHAAAVRLAVAVDWGELAEEISADVAGKPSASTPEPFRGVLRRASEYRLWLQAQEALGAPPTFQEPSAVYRPLVEARAWERVSGQRLPLERRAALWVRAFEIGEAQVERGRPEGAEVVFQLLDEEADYLRGRPEAEALATLRAERGPRLDFALGKLLYHAYLWDKARWPELRAALGRGAAASPVRARLFLLGVWAAEHQRWVVGAAALLLGLGALFGFSGAGARLRLRAWVWLTGRSSAGAWRALVRLSGLDAKDAPQAKLRARGAAWLIDRAHAHGDPNLAEEASALLGSVAPAWRPEGWRVGAASVARVAKRLDDARDATALERALVEARVVEQVFAPHDPAAASAARCLGALARCALARHGLGAAEPQTLAEALGAAQAALRGWEGSPKVEVAHDLRAQARDKGLDVADPSAELRARVGLWTARLGPRWGLEGAWDKAWALLRPLEAAPTSLDKKLAAQVAEARLLAAASAAPTREALAVLAWAREAGAGPQAQEEALWAMAQRASLEQGEEPWEALDAQLSAQLPPERALAARLRLLVLRRLASQTRAQLWGAPWDARCAALLAQAQGHQAVPEVAALAQVLDLLYEGDGGFDAQVAQAQGAQRARFLLTQALDHMTAGRAVEAAAALFEAEPQRAAPSTGARLWAARAVVAGTMGQRRAAREALARAVALAREAGAAALAAVDEAAAQLLGLLWAEDDPRLLERAAMGWLGREGAPPVPWWGLAGRLALEADPEVVLGLLRRSEAQEPAAAAQRRSIFSILARRAVREGDYTRASACAILAGAEERGPS